MEFNIAKVLVSALGYKGLPYPGVWFPSGKITGEKPEYQYEGQEKDVKTHSDLGSVLRKQDAQGRYYFMPVVLEHKGKEYENTELCYQLHRKKEHCRNCNDRTQR